MLGFHGWFLPAGRVAGSVPGSFLLRMVDFLSFLSPSGERETQSLQVMVQGLLLVGLRAESGHEPSARLGGPVFLLSDG